MRTYNPLNVGELGKSVARALMAYQSCSLPLDESIEGGGVYTLHYRGALKAYAGMSDREPIYVGKADLPGKRQGQSGASGSFKARSLNQRITKHAETISSARNLRVSDFRCRWLVLDPIWVGLTEQVLIAEYRPIWNVIVDGFGNNDPGKGRRKQKRSQWDTIHPGREWAEKLDPNADAARIIWARIKQHRIQTGSLP